MNMPSPRGSDAPLRSARGQLPLYALVVLPFFATIYALWDWAHNGVAHFFPILALAGYVVTGLGITVGYHRLFTHQSFTATKPVRWILGVAGLMALQGRIADWCGQHQTHHTYSDKPGKDPHTPFEYGYSWSELWKGFWHAHFGWLLFQQSTEPNATYSRLRGDPLVSKIDSHVLFWSIMGFVIPSALGFAYTQSLHGAWLGLIWGGGVRLFIVQHVTWSVNSVCHMWGRRPFKTRDWSRDNWLVAFLGFGEGFHNGHHAFMQSPVHGINTPWLDISYVTIRTLEALGLAKDVRKNIPSRDMIESQRIQ